ncbi:hypothetical protein FQN60_006091 [Etheostoma spectabile]|uniref:Uncharacterized protein n=1 Tax=Etheostoma spectabile TaxID=54343 RepID=A0A5J5CA84_9PERO|nr:hypothetical protein FQN60_006091 [Etheostoma spectabile]
MSFCATGQEQHPCSSNSSPGRLPLYLKEDSSEVFRTCKDELEAIQDGAVALVAVVNEEEVPAGVPFETHHVSIVLEDQVVMSPDLGLIHW